MTSTASGADAGEATNAMGDRRGLSDRTALVRIAAVFGIVLFLLAIILANLFYGFDGTLQRLLVLSIGHLLLTPLAFIASLRLGFLLTIAAGVAALVLLLDTVQLAIRVFDADLTIEYIVLLAANIGLASISLLQVIALANLRKADRELNDGVVDGDSTEKRAAMVRQESNALRAIAVFAVTAVVIVLLTLAVLGDFTISAHGWALFYLGHVLVAGVALLGAPNGGLWVLVFLGLALLQTALDLLQFTLRLLDRPDVVIEVLSLTNIVTTTLLIITVAFIIIDVSYITSGLGLLDALNTSIVADIEDDKQPTKIEAKARASSPTPAVFQSPADLHGAPVRRRK
jgi:hypothetical protein